MKRRLMRLQSATPRVRFVYVFRFMPETGKVIFLGDSAKPGAADESLPGDDYPQAGQSPGLQEIIQSGLPATEGPLRDGFGVWVTGYAQIAEGPAAAAAPPRKEIVGIDLDAADWSRALWSAAAIRASLMWLVLGLPLAAWNISRRQLEQREAIRNLSEAMEQSHSALMIVDLESRIEFANRGLVQQIGYSRRELIGRNWRDFQVTDTPPERLAEMVSTVRSGHAWEGEWFNRRKDGTVYPVRGVITPVKNRDGRLASFVAVFDDMTAVKQQEAELREARDLAQAGDRAKGQFLATMSHEVRTPLNGIIGFTNLLLNSPLTAEQRDYVDTIRAGGEALMQLTGDILDFARIETGKLKLELTPCDPRACIEEALDLLAEIANAKKLTLLHWVDDGVPATILADAGRLRQVLVNLLSNAVKFTEAGEVEVIVTAGRPESAAAAPPAADHCLLRFSVRDTGMGIAVAEGSKLFKPFTQLDSSSTRKHGGTGLGLAISRDLVRLMGGDIVFASEPGHGSTFSFTLPAPVVAAAPVEAALDGLRLALIGPAGPFRRELVRLAARWRATVLEADGLATLPTAPWDLALVAIDEAQARALAAQAEPTPGLPPAKVFALVPVTLGTDVRTALRHHFRLIINYPPRHAALLGMLRDVRPAAPAAAPAAAHYGLRVLVVEDNAVNQRLVLKMLESVGCTGTVVANGRLAVDELARRAAAYDFVLLDLHMPELDGLGALGEIRTGRAGALARHMWIAALTADAREEQKARAAAAGINDYLVKPLLLPDLEAAFLRYQAARGPAAR
jgi:PAS domain S-box-containing protein